MGVLLSHIDLGPVFYGVILAIWMLIVVLHLLNGNILAVIIDIVAFTIVIKIHGGTLTGGMAATVCGLIVSLVIPIMLKRYFGRK